MSIFGYLLAISLVIFSVLNWKSQPGFMVVCTAIWTLFTIAVVTRLWMTNRASQKNKALEIPDNWETIDSDVTADSSSVPVTPVAPVTPVTPVAPAVTLAQQAIEAEPALATRASPQIPVDIRKTVVDDTAVIRLPESRPRASQLDQYRRERLTRHREKRNKSRSTSGNLAVYGRDTTNKRTSNGN